MSIWRVYLLSRSTLEMSKHLMLVDSENLVHITLIVVNCNF